MVVNDFFTLTPHGNQGYLVFNYQQYPDVKTWNYSIKETQTEDSATTTQIIKRYGYGGVNYGRVPLEYLRNHFEEGIVYSLEATGFNALAEPVITTTIGNLCPGCVPGEIVKTFKCNGSTYAWEANIYKVGLQYYAMIWTNYDYYDELYQICIPYYQYTFENTLINMLNTNVQISHFSLNGNWYYLYTNLYYVLSSTVPFIIPNLYSSGKLLYLDNVQIADNIKDQFGNVLYGNDVRGINKMEGFWRNSPVIGPYDESTMNTISSVADLLLLYNSNSDWNALNIPYLECDQSEPEPNEDHGTYESLNCFIDYEESILTAGGGVLTLNGIIDAIGDCFESGDIGSELGSIPQDSSLIHLWPMGLKAIQIFRVDSIHSISSVITPNLFADTSAFNIYNFNLPRGLYLFNLVLYNNKILPLYIDAKQSITSSYNQSDLLNALVYPVPTVENYFNIRFNSPISLKFSYELYSPDGLRLYQENYSIEGGIESNFHIRPTHGILPNGLLGHVLKFPDGSTKSFTTIKISN